MEDPEGRAKDLEDRREDRGEERKCKIVRRQLEEKRLLEGVMFGVIMRHDGGRQRERMVLIPNGVKHGPRCF